MQSDSKTDRCLALCNLTETTITHSEESFPWGFKGQKEGHRGWYQVPTCQRFALGETLVVCSRIRAMQCTE